MAIKLVSNYAKRLGLPGYSSHQFSVSVETELTDLSQVQDEAVRLYGLLQDAVDREIQQTGFVPGHDYGEVTQGRNSNGNGQIHANGNGNGNGGSNGNGKHQYRLNGGGNGSSANGNGRSNGSDHWSCSDKQKELILKLVTENGLDRDTIEQTALDRFGMGVRQLNKLQASGLISELLELCGKVKGGGR